MQFIPDIGVKITLTCIRISMLISVAIQRIHVNLKFNERFSFEIGFIASFKKNELSSIVNKKNKPEPRLPWQNTVIPEYFSEKSYYKRQIQFN